MSSEPRVRGLAVGIAALYLVAHAACLAPSLEDVDSINFALGLRHFDVANHQPHPPGSPVYIALGRFSLAIVTAVMPSLDKAHADALALASWSALGGAVALLAVFSLLASVDLRSSRSIWATALLAACPLFWIVGARPMSDMPGLALALVSQALALRGSRSALVGAALVAGLAAGLRVQTACLTVPLLAYAVVQQRRAGLGWLVSRPIAALAAGGLLWVIPLLVVSGGLDGYLRALGSQAGEDFAWSGMLWTNPTPRRLMFALWDTFVQPWESIPLAIVVGLLSVVGAALTLVRDRRAFALMTLAFAPYALFHLAFQETSHVRYAMPTLPLMAWLAISAASLAGRLFPAVSGLVVVAALVYAVPTGVAYAKEAHPAFRAIETLRRAATRDRPAAVYAHFALRRPLQAAEIGSLRVIEPRRTYEWLGLVDYWRDGGDAPVWFLADPHRTDLALIDPQSRRDMTHFGWSVADRRVLRGTRPLDADWYRFDQPGWFAGQGWGLTPETGGIAQATGTGVDRRPIEAYVRRRSGAMHLLVGGRHFSAAGDPSVVVGLSIDGALVETWRVDPAPGGSSFLQFADLAGLPAGRDRYARLTITARSEPDTRPTPQIAIRQFDIQPAQTLIYGFGEGWHEAEYDNATGQSWRWTSRRSVLRVSPPQAVVVHLRGESPLKYLDAAPTVRISAGGRVVGELHPTADFDWRVAVPAEAVRGGEGAIAIETDRIYRPGEVEGTGDVRQLGLRLFEIDVSPDTLIDRGSIGR